MAKINIGGVEILVEQGYQNFILEIRPMLIIVNMPGLLMYFHQKV